jgi:hypothetical protein
MCHIQFLALMTLTSWYITMIQNKIKVEADSLLGYSDV